MTNSKLSYIFRSGSPVIVFLHGLGMNKESSYPLYNSSIFQKYGFLSIDLPGHGQSLKYSNVDSYEFKKMTIDILKLLSRLGIKSYELIAHSISSYFIPFLVNRDIKLNSIILIEGNLSIDDSSWTSYINKLDKDAFDRHHLMIKKTAYKSIQSQLKTTISRSEINLYSKGLLDVDPSALMYYSINSIKLLQDNSLINLIKKYKGNILYIRGDDDRDWKNTYAILNNYKIKISKILNSSHFPHIDQSIMTSQKINEFYKLII